jgi:hypothetical protein
VIQDIAMANPKIALVLPPFTQLNTPYPSIGYLARCLSQNGYNSSLRDFGIELALKIYSREGVGIIFDYLEHHSQITDIPEEAWRAIVLRENYENTVDDVISFLQGNNGTLASRILSGHFLPMGPRLSAANLEPFGTMGRIDAARYLATLYLEDISDIITEMIDPGFSFARYQPQLATGPVSFSPIAKRLEKTTLIDTWLDELIETIDADIVGISVPFPGTLYGALRIGKKLKQKGKTIWLGGGYINTELREIHDDRFWQCVDRVTYDDGEGPIIELLKDYLGQKTNLHRTRSKLLYYNEAAPYSKFIAAAKYNNLDLSQYLQVIDTLNPTHRIWSDGRWNKITLAHGCYWKKCAFCDINLDYIERYEPTSISTLVDTIEELIAETGVTGFHFVDEAAPPSLMKKFALELLRRKINITWWGNIRFEKAFTTDLCALLAKAGLIAVTGGLETASNRLLKYMNKGITIEQAACTTAAFQQSGIMVHAYLMYGFPTQTIQETIDSMEVVRQMFAQGLLNSGFWHRFTLTKHSAIFQNPSKYKVQIPPLPEGSFTSNDLDHIDVTGIDHDLFDTALSQSLNQWMQGKNLDVAVHQFFQFEAPKTSVKKNLIKNAVILSDEKENGRLLWTGEYPLFTEHSVLFHSLDSYIEIPINTEEEQWLCDVLEDANIGSEERPYKDDIKNKYPRSIKRFKNLWIKLKKMGMIVL